VIEKAIRLELPLFQCFLILQETGKLLPLADDDVASFLALRRTHFKHLYVHGSYRINISGVHYYDHFALSREIAMARRLEFTHMVLHAGSSSNKEDKLAGIEAMARVLNKLVKYEHDMQIVLENAAHGNNVVGGDLEEFRLLRLLLDQPDKILFCIDTAHAYSYGYNIADATGRDAFIKEIDHTVGIENVVLLHLNDTNEALGSKRDKHAVVGQGAIGNEVLKAWALHPRLKDIPMIMELPELDEREEMTILEKARGWHIR